jgi:hypothetical protein
MCHNVQHFLSVFIDIYMYSLGSRNKWSGINVLDLFAGTPGIVKWKCSLVDTSFLLKASDMRKSSLNYRDIYDWKGCATDGYKIIFRLFE